MNRIVFTVLMFLVACNADTNEPDLLTQPPFAELSDSIRLFPSNADLHYKRGVLLYQNRHHVHAEKDLRTAWALSPTEAHALSMTTLLRAKHPDSAVVFLEGATRKLPESIALRVGLARGYQSVKQYDKAVQILDGIIADYPNQIDALLLKSEIRNEENKKGEALRLLEQAYRYAPFDREIGYELAYQYAESGHPNALSLTDSLIASDQTETVSQAYYIKGVYHDRKGNNAEAIRLYDQAIQANYNLMDAYREKGLIYYDAKKYTEALSTFRLAQQIAPAAAEFYFLIGRTQEAMGNKEEAKLNYQRAFSLDKTYTEAKEAAERI